MHNFENRFGAGLAAVALLAAAGVANAAVSFTGSYSQNFDTLSNTGTANAWVNDSTLAGWSLFHRTSATDATPVATVSYSTGTGSSNTGAWYSFGATAGAERALGGVASSNATAWGVPATGAVAGWMTVALTNATGGTLTNLGISFDGEEWRDGGATTPAAQTMVLEYGYGASFTAVTTWTAPGGNFDWTSPVFANTASGAAVDGNGAGLVAGRGGTLTGQTWNDGDTLWIRWIENNDVGNDHGLAIDNVSFSATPAPGAMGLLGVGMLVVARRRR